MRGPLDSRAPSRPPGFFWRDARGFHALFHSKNACGQKPADVASCGAMAWSEDSWTWHLNTRPCYNSSVLWKEDDGSVTHDTLLGRQRPKILFDDDGVPQFLYNGIESADAPFRQWTLATPFNV